MTESKQPTIRSESQNVSSKTIDERPAVQRHESSGGETARLSSDPEADRHPIDILADEYSARLRAGESPSIEEYEQRAPDHWQMIRTLFPTIALIEQITLRDRAEKRTRQHAQIDRPTIGDFRIIREIGRGGMGIVYEAIQCSLARRVALKVLGSGIANSPHQLNRFQREAESAARLHHTNIVPVYGIGEDEGFHFYAMQFIDGIPLADAIATVRNRSSITQISERGDISHPELQSGQQGSLNPESDGPVSPNSAIDDPTVLVTIGPETNTVNGEDQAIDDRWRNGNDDRARDIAGIPNILSLVQRMEHGDDSDNQAVLKSTAESVDVCFGFFANNTSPDYFLRIANLMAQVADALEYAHQHGVLHRDIKPANLMIDRSGSVWVMDFGLVKIIEQKDLTLAGEIVGTLRYMAPEQLEGRADARTDIYGLGLTLFELLTLKPAFDGDEAGTLAKRLRQSEIPRLRSLNLTIPLDLETIVLKATSREPFARYATAAELAEDLRRFCDDRPILARRTTYLERLWRWSRRNPALASATVSSMFLLCLVALVASVGWLRVNAALHTADAARTRAETNLASAIDAFDGILENVKSRGLPRSFPTDALGATTESGQIASSDYDARLLNRLLEFYRRFASDNADNALLRRKTADAHHRAGAILVRLGQLSDAEQDYETAMKMLSEIHAANRHDVDAVVSLASIHNEIGELYLRRGEFDKTFKSHLEARALLFSLSDKSKSELSVRSEFARATDLLASIDIRSGTDEGPQSPPDEGPGGQRPPGGGNRQGDRTTPTDSTAAEDHSESPRFLRRRGNDLNFSGAPPDGPPPGPPPSEHLNNRLKRALPQAFLSDAPMQDGLAKTLLEASDIFRSLIEESPEISEYQFRCAQCLRHRLVHAAGNGELDVVKVTFREAIEILERLRAKFPEDPKYVYELADTLTQAVRAEDDEQALESLGRAVSDAELLTEHFPNISEYQLLKGTALARLAAVEAKIRDLVDAEVNLTISIKTLKRLTQQFPDQGVMQIPLAKTRQQLGDFLRSAASLSETPDVRLNESLIELQRAIEGFEAYLSQSENHAKGQRMGHFNFETRTSLYVSLAETLALLHRDEEAQEARTKGARH